MDKNNVVDSLLKYKNYLEDPDTGKQLSIYEVEQILIQLGAI
jgi:hypothetical protein